MFKIKKQALKQNKILTKFDAEVCVVDFELVYIVDMWHLQLLNILLTTALSFSCSICSKAAMLSASSWLQCQ